VAETGAPILLLDQEWGRRYLADSAGMLDEYAEEKVSRGLSYWERRRRQDYRTKDALEAFEEVVGSAPADAICLSIGGGPAWIHPNLTNLNIGPFPNVHVVADAHHLPYVDRGVDAVYAEGVLEHLSRPADAAREMMSVLRPGGKLYAVTPFMQAYHGYPHHYQNLTLTGHRLLFESAGFKVLRAGTCTGPTAAMDTLIAIYNREYLPPMLAWWIRRAWGILSLALRRYDRRLNLLPNSHVLASSTYVLAVKEAI
jgi:SAM-dependent methyltransferase